MSNNSNLLYGFIICLLGFVSCKPACDEIFQLTATPPAAVGGSEIVIRSTNPDMLKGGQVSVNSVDVEAEFDDDADGLIITLPPVEDRATQSDIIFHDPDCGETYVTRNFDLLTSQAGFNNVSAGYIVPAPPNIIIPLTPPPPPPVIQNAWFSPDNSDYCIWFRFFKNQNDESTTILRPAEFPGDTLGAAELAACTRPSVFHGNPVFGIIMPPDEEKGDMGYINFTIDRRNNEVGGIPDHLVMEEFEGQFFNIGDTPEYETGVGNGCGPTIPESNFMMVVYSKATGRPLVMFRGS